MVRRIASSIVLMALWLVADTGAGIKWTAPSDWKAEAERPMRLATYTIPPAAGDSEPAECGVYYFGPGQGGSVEANMSRWIGQFQSKEPAQRDQRTVHGLKVTTVDVSGAYSGMGGPMAKAGAPPKLNYRLLGAIVEGPQGSVFFKLTGPAKTVAQNQAAFDKLIASLQPIS
jgi:hypothetical protein